MKEIHPNYEGVNPDDYPDYVGDHPGYPAGVCFGEQVPGDKLHLGTIIVLENIPIRRAQYFHDPFLLISGIYYIKTDKNWMWQPIDENGELISDGRQ